ncbi:MAG: zinc transporter ZupT [Bacteroidales bacterium]|nr:zinc transporter ZupT [Bacteroidales bacterium]
MEGNVLLAFGLTLFAGLSTGIGSALAFFTKTTNTRFLSWALGFSGGVMIYVAFTEILGKSQELFVGKYGEVSGNWFTVISFFAGIFIIAIIDILVPSYENPHEIHRVEEIPLKNNNGKKKNMTGLMRMGIFMAIAIAIHNFPEGLATFAAGIADIKIAIPIALAIAIHNIPEGIAVSVPIYYATGNRKKAFFLSLLSGLAEPLGALIGYFLLSAFFSDSLMGVLFGGVAGIMVFISIDELLPTARAYGHHHQAIYGMVAGMVVMAISLLLFIQ